MKSIQIFNHLQFFFAKAGYLGQTPLNTSFLFLSLFLPYKVFICSIYILSWLFQFWNMFHNEVGNKSPYKTSINNVRLRFQKLQKKNKQVEEIRAKNLGQDSWKNFKEVLHYQELPYISQIIGTKLISKYCNNLLVEHFQIKKI